jgi:hypothetical protein
MSATSSQLAQEPEAQLGAMLLAAPEHDSYFDLVTGLEESQDVTLFGLVVMRVDLWPEFHLLDDRLLLVSPGFPGLERALVLELAEVHELADRRACHRRNLDQIQIHIRGQLQGSLQWDDAHLLPFRADQTDLSCPDLLVHAWLDADESSSIVFSDVRPANRRPGAAVLATPEPARPVMYARQRTQNTEVLR